MRVPVIAGNWKMHKTRPRKRASLARAIRDGAGAAHPLPGCAGAAVHGIGCRRRRNQRDSADPGCSECALGAEGRFYRRDQHPHAAKISGAGWSLSAIPSAGNTSAKPMRPSTAGCVPYLDSTLQPIVCIGETLAERESGIHHSVVAQQLAGGLDGLTRQDLLRIILAYEPVWAIGTGRTASPEIAQEMHGAIREWLSEKFGEKRRRRFAFYMAAASSRTILTI